MQIDAESSEFHGFNINLNLRHHLQILTVFFTLFRRQENKSLCEIFLYKFYQNQEHDKTTLNNQQTGIIKYFERMCRLLCISIVSE